MKLLLNIMLQIFVLASLLSCKGGSTNSFEGGDTVTLKYAKHLKLVKHEGFTVAILENPWDKGKVLHTYIIVPKDNKLPSRLPEGTVVRTPLTRAVATTSVHCSLIMELGKKESIRGICDLKYINIPWIKNQNAANKIADCGSSIAPNIEKIIEADADAILISPFQNSGGYGRLEEWGNPIIEVADYMETSALGRAEWIKFYGMLFGAENEADSIFNKVEANYNRLKQIAGASPKGKSVLFDKITGSVWYVPGGGSTLGQIVQDANSGYAFKDDKSSGSLSLSAETILSKASNSDVWLIRYNTQQDDTYASLLNENNIYSLFKAFKDKQIYGCNTGKTTFYEDTPFHPDLLLRDIIIITHPELRTLGTTKYFKKIK